MRETATTSVIFTAFANPKGDLNNLTLEQNGIQDVLLPFEQKGLLKKHLIRTDTDLDAYFNFLRQWENQIGIFHYAGHAGSEGIALQNAHTFFEPLAKELAHRNKDSLRLVFLNGCSTFAHVKTLLGLGVKAVIATSVKIDDALATQFAIRFYQNLANGDSLKTAYESAANYAKGQRSEERLRYFGEIRSVRDVGAGEPATEAPEVFPWGLYVAEAAAAVLEERLLEAEKPAAQKTFNEYLTKALMEATQPHSTAAARFLERAGTMPNWETDGRIGDKAKEILAYSFVGVIGIQLSKLMAIGKEDLSTSKQRKYVEKCLQIAKRSLDLVTFALVSRLWDEQKQQPRTCSDTEKKVLNDFFERLFEPTINDQLRVLQVLLTIFKQHTLPLPMPELSEFDAHFQADSPFQRDCQCLQQLLERFEKTPSTADCFAAEQALATFLSAFHFLTRYRMASIRHIGYRQLRNGDPHFLHRYTALGIDSKANVDAEKINFTTETAHTDSVLLYRGAEGYMDYINLTPFVIDYNTLTAESGTKICFFHAKDLADGSLDYCFLEDNSLINLAWKGILKPDTDYNELLMLAESRKILSLDNVLEQFRAAHKAVAGDAFDVDDL